MVQMKYALGGIPVSAAMITNFQTVTRDYTLQQMTELILSGSQQDFPVMEGDRVAGVLTREALLRALASKGDGYVGEFMRKDIAVVNASDMLESAFRKLQESGCPTMPVVQNGRLVGILTTENLGEYLMIHNALGGRKPGLIVA